MSERRRNRVNNPATVEREYAAEDRFLARRLTTWAELRGPLVEDTAIRAVGERTPEIVLDLGCGTGDTSERLARELSTVVVALDLSPRMAALAAGRDLPAANGDVQALPFADGALGCVLANRVLYHVPDLDRGLAEVARVLRSDGMLVVITYSPDHLSELWDLVGESPIAASAATDVDASTLEAHFQEVEQHDVVGVARFASPSAIAGYLAAYGEFAQLELPVLGEISVPLDATYRHTMLIARAPR